MLPDKNIVTSSLSNFGELDYWLPENEKINYSSDDLYDFIKQAATVSSGVYFTIYDKKHEFVRDNYLNDDESELSFKKISVKDELISNMKKVSSILPKLRLDNLNTSMGVKFGLVKLDVKIQKTFDKAKPELNSCFFAIQKIKDYILKTRKKSEDGVPLKLQKLKDLLKYKHYMMQVLPYMDDLHQNNPKQFPIGINSYETLEVEFKKHLIDLEQEIIFAHTEFVIGNGLVNNASSILQAIDNLLVEYTAFFSIFDKFFDYVSIGSIPETLTQSMSEAIDKQEKHVNDLLKTIQ